MLPTHPDEPVVTIIDWCWEGMLWGSGSVSKTSVYLLEMGYLRPVIDTDYNNAGVSGSIYVVNAIDFMAAKTPALQVSAKLVDRLGPYTYLHRVFDTSKQRFP